ncbi:MAG TPA: hypothetical protein VHH11_05185 [Gammaproteobacteria bacterium]|nr:hypothetical protein [Gammaproteobacteria bacterium]
MATEEITPIDAPPTREQYALLFSANGRVSDIVPAIKGVATQFYTHLFDDLPEDAQLLAHALQELTEKLYQCAHDVPWDLEQRVRMAIERPDDEREAMDKRLRDAGFSLWCHPRVANSYAVADDQGRCHLSVVSLEEIAGWLERRAGVAP